MSKLASKFAHYHKPVSHLESIDVYRVLDLWKVTDPCIQHAIKKLLATGKRGAKDSKTDIAEARDSLDRCLEMISENELEAGIE